MGYCGPRGGSRGVRGGLKHRRWPLVRGVIPLVHGEILAVGEAAPRGPAARGVLFKSPGQRRRRPERWGLRGRWGLISKKNCMGKKGVQKITIFGFLIGFLLPPLPPPPPNYRSTDKKRKYINIQMDKNIKHNPVGVYHVPHFTPTDPHRPPYFFSTAAPYFFSTAPPSGVNPPIG